MASHEIGFSHNSLSINKEKDSSEKQVQTKSQINFNKRILPRVSQRLLFFQKNKPQISFSSKFRALASHDDIISQSEIILMQRDYEFLHTEPNDMIEPNPRIKKSLKVHRRNEVRKQRPTPPSSEVISYIETNPFYLHQMPNQNKIGNTLYTVLTKKRNQFFEQLSQHKDKRPILPQMTSEAMKREKCIHVNQPNTNYSDMNKRDAIPIVHPIACINDVSYANISERERYQRLREELLKEKELINRKPEYCLFILKEFLLRNAIYENKYYEEEYLSNLDEFLNSNMAINTKKTLREHIIEGLNYKAQKKPEKDECNEAENNSSRRIIIKKKKKKPPEEIKECSNIRTDMELQKNLYENKLLQTQIDFEKSPKDIVNLLEDDFSEEANKLKQLHQTKAEKKTKTESPHHENERLYEDKTVKKDFNYVKKNNKILEYICYVKAKNIIHFREIKKKLMIEDLSKASVIRHKSKT